MWTTWNLLAWTLSYVIMIETSVYFITLDLLCLNYISLISWYLWIWPLLIFDLWVIWVISHRLICLEACLPVLATCACEMATCVISQGLILLSVPGTRDRSPPHRLIGRIEPVRAWSSRLMMPLDPVSCFWYTRVLPPVLVFGPGKVGEWVNGYGWWVGFYWTLILAFPWLTECQRTWIKLLLWNLAPESHLYPFIFKLLFKWSLCTDLPVREAWVLNSSWALISESSGLSSA